MPASTQKSGPNQRGEDSRQRIIETALAVFGRHGYEGASTRQLALTAGVNLAALRYYFGGKEGLYLAVAEHVITAIARHQTPAVFRAEAAMADPDLPPQAALEALLDVLDSITAMLISDGPAAQWAQFIMREQMHPTAAFDIIYNGFQVRLHGLVTALVARVTGKNADDPDTLISATTLIGQILVFRAARATVQRRHGWDAFTPDRVAQVRAVIRRQVQAMYGPGSGLQT